MGIRVAKGTMETPDGKHNFQFLPHGQHVPDEYFDATSATVKDTIKFILDLKQEVAAEFQGKHNPPSRDSAARCGWP